MPKKSANVWVASIITRVMREDLRRIAKREQRSISSMISVLIAERLEQERKEKWQPKAN